MHVLCDPGLAIGMHSMAKSVNVIDLKATFYLSQATFIGFMFGSVLNVLVRLSGILL